MKYDLKATLKVTIDYHGPGENVKREVFITKYAWSAYQVITKLLNEQLLVVNRQPDETMHRGVNDHTNISSNAVKAESSYCSCSCGKGFTDWGDIMLHLERDHEERFISWAGAFALNKANYYFTPFEPVMLVYSDWVKRMVNPRDIDKLLQSDVSVNDPKIDAMEGRED